MRLENFMLAYQQLAQQGWSVNSIQALGFESGTGTPLVCDGMIGPKTRNAYYVVPDGGEPKLVKAMLDFVRRGVQEDGGNNRGAGPAEMYGACSVDDCDPDDWDEIKQGAWCAATVSRAILNCGLVTFKLIGGARRLTDWLVKQFGKSAAKVGAVISWKIPRPGVPAGGHVGVMCFCDPAGRWFVIEGNGSARAGRVRLYRYEADLKYGTHPVHKIAPCPV